MVLVQCPPGDCVKNFGPYSTHKTGDAVPLYRAHVRSLATHREAQWWIDWLFTRSLSTLQKLWRGGDNFSTSKGSLQRVLYTVRASNQKLMMAASASAVARAEGTCLFITWWWKLVVPVFTCPVTFDSAPARSNAFSSPAPFSWSYFVRACVYCASIWSILKKISSLPLFFLTCKLCTRCLHFPFSYRNCQLQDESFCRSADWQQGNYSICCIGATCCLPTSAQQLRSWRRR